MIIVMRADATPQQVQTVSELVLEAGLKPQPIQGTDLVVVAVIGDDRLKDSSKFEQVPGVDRILRVLSPYKMAAVETTAGQRTLVRVGEGESCVFGGANVPVIAGPCSVEGEDKIIEIAQQVKAAGAHALRGGAFKPRTNPYAFQGHGEDGLRMLSAARDATGLPIVTEVLTPADVPLVAKYADCLQIGTRNAQNFKLLEAVGESGKPVLFKRGMAMTIDEYLQAADYILAAGNPNVILCERGIRTFEDHTRNTLPLATVPALKRRSHLPIVVDPSHGTGHAYLVPDMSRAAIAAGCDGLAIECHQDPAHAMTDGAQSITPAVLAELMGSLARVAEAVDRTCLPLINA
ncbi:MAG: 3-deoxy-7-phosphoheptulonate synthase [Phycisphaeraceae bacterium]